MKRKTFIKSSSALAAGTLLSPYLSCVPAEKTESKSVASDARKNWAGNYTYQAPNFHEPATVEELQELVQKLDKQKAMGSTHCFNNIADSPKHQISTRKLDKWVALDEENGTLTVEAGVRYGDFSVQLHESGYALHNLASLPHITVAGACTTATHGSGVNNGNLATGVRSLEMVTPTGELVTIEKDHPDYHAVVVGLGAFGIITRITLEVQNTFDVRQDVFLDLPLESATDRFQEIMTAGYSVSFFTNWMGKKVSEVWIKRRLDQDPTDLGTEFCDAKAATRNLHPVVEQSAESCSEQMGVPGPWYDRLPHFKMGFTPSTGAELQSEFFVPLENAVEAILAGMRDEIYPHLIITEIRTIAFDDFVALAREYDPDGKFRNSFLQQHIFG